MPVKRARDISKRLALGFGTMVLLAVAISLAAIFSVIKLGMTNSSMYEHPLTVSKAIGDINSGILAIHRTMKDVVLAQNDHEIDSAVELVNTYEKSVYESFNIVSQRFLGDKSDVENALKTFEDWRPIRQEVIELSRIGEKQAAAAITTGRGARHVDKMNLAVGVMRKFADNKALSYFNSSRHVLQLTLMSICIVAFVAIFAGATIALRTTNSIVRPLLCVVTGIEQVKSGDLDYKINLQTDDEIGVMAAAFDQMLERLKLTMACRDELDAINRRLASEIANHRLTADQLAHEHEQLRITLDSIGDGVITTDKEGKVVMQNPMSQKLTGYTEEEAKGLPLEKVFNIVNYDTRQKVENPVGKVLSTGKIVGLANHTVLISKDGKEYQIADSASPIRDSEGEILGVVLVFRDVTAEYEHNREMFERSERQRLAVDAGGMGLWDWNIETDTVIVDDNWKQITYWKKIGYEMPMSQISANIHPDDKNLFKLSMEECHNGDSNFYDESFRFSSGADSWVWLRFVGRVMEWDTKGRPVRMMGVTQNITERRNMELNLAREKENLKTTLNCIGDGVIATDIDGRITRINPVAQHLTGWNQWEAQGRAIEEVFNVIDEDTREPSENIVLKVGENLSFTGFINHKILTNRLGGEYHVSCSAAPIKDKDGHAEGIVVVFKNVTDDYLRRKELYDKAQYLKLSIDAAGVGLWEWNILTGRFVVDDNWVKMFRWEGDKVFHINTSIVNVHQDDAEEVRRAIDECLCGKTSDYDVSFRYKIGEDEWIWVRALGKVVERDSKGRPVKFMGVNVNITELKESQLALFYEKENIRITLNSIGDGVIATDTEGRVVSLNPISERLTGWTTKEAKGKDLEKVFNIINAITRQKAENPVKKVFETGKIVGLANHTTLISRNGDEYQIADSAAPIIDAAGKINGVVLVFRDVTQEYIQNQLLFEETERRRLAVDAAKIGIWDWNIKNDTFVVDEGWIRMLNWKGQSTIAVDQIMKIVHPDDVKTVQDAMGGCVSGQEKDFSCSFRFNLPMSTRWILTLGRAVEFDEDGKPTRILGVNQDITRFKDIEFKLRESEQRFRAMFDKSPLMIALLNTELKPEFLNKSYEKLGYSLDELTHIDSTNITHPDYRELNEANYQKLLSGQIDDFVEEKKYICKNGATIDVELVAVAIKDEVGELKYILTMATDITHRNKILDELRRSNQELEQFAYVASHDLREPLRTIGLYTELLEREYGELFDNDASTYMRFVILGVKRMNALIHGLLEYSRIGHQHSNLTDIDTNKIIDTVKANLDGLITQNKAVINSDKLPVVHGDELKLVQLFQNIISNAIRFKAPDRIPEVFISSQKNGSKYQFAIKDNGIGVEKKYHDKIFNIFSRLHGKEDYEGSGIGLAVAKKIVEAHGGEIWLESKPGKGSVFYFTIIDK